MQKVVLRVEKRLSFGSFQVFWDVSFCSGTPGTVPCQQVIQTGLIWGADVSGEGLCKGQAVARLLALGAAESEYMLQGECGQSWKGQLGWCEIGLDVYICLYLKLQPHNLFLCCF